MRLERKTRRLLLRPFKAKDYAAWREARSAMPAPRNTWDHPPAPLKDLSRRGFAKILKTQRENQRKDSYYDLGVFLNDGSFIGTVSIMDISRRVFQNAYLGYRIFNRHWGKGYGAEAVRAGVDIAFRDIRLHRLEAGIEPGNIRSIRLARRLGFRREGFSKRRLFLRGKWVDLYNYAMTCEEAGIPWESAPRLPKDRL